MGVVPVEELELFRTVERWADEIWMEREKAVGWYATATGSLKSLNALITYRRQAAGIVSEEAEDYYGAEDDPFAPTF